MNTTITVREETWKQLAQKKLDLNCASFDDLIIKLIESYNASKNDLIYVEGKR